MCNMHGFLKLPEQNINFYSSIFILSQNAHKCLYQNDCISEFGPQSAVCILAWKSSSIYKTTIIMSTYLSTYLLPITPSLPTCQRIPTKCQLYRQHTYIHTCIHTYIHTYATQNLIDVTFICVCNSKIV